MNTLSKILIVSGSSLLVSGLIVLLWDKFKLPLLPFKLFHLPGDFFFQGENWSFYFPLTSCLLLSLLLPLLLKLFDIFKNLFK